MLRAVITVPVETAKVQLVFAHGIEALFIKALGVRIDRTCRERLRAEGLDLDRKLLPAYEFSLVDRCQKIVADSVYPDKSPNEAAWLLGEAQVMGYVDTFIGRALFSVLKLLGPKRILSRLTHSWRSGNNFIETKMTEAGPNRFEVWVNQVGNHPEFSQAVLATAMRLAGNAQVKVEVLKYERPNCTFLVSWPSGT
jgi:uncharacterized protein (TIGR02265 family)